MVPAPGNVAVTDIGVGANNALWAIGGDAVPGGQKIFRWTGSAWETVPGARCASPWIPTGQPWVINDHGTIFRRKGSDWEAMPGAATDVGIGADGTVWVIGSGGTPHRWDGSAWKAISGGGTSIAVGPKGEPWVVNAAGSIWRYPMPSGPWELVPGKAQDIAVAADGTAFVVGTGTGTVSRLHGGAWVADPSAAGRGSPPVRRERSWSRRRERPCWREASGLRKPLRSPLRRRARPRRSPSPRPARASR